MSVRPFKASIGKRLIPQSDTSTEAEFVRSVRAQFNDILKNYNRFVDHMELSNVEILYDALRPVYDQSQIEVPKKTGALAASGYLETRMWRGRQIVEIGYARGGRPNYAAMVHENLEAYHYAPTKAKFLEDPLREQEDAIRARIIEGLEVASGV